MGLSGRLVVLLAVACGATVANLYYAQPLLDTIARALKVSSGTAGLLVTATQFGYVAGLLVIVPLGDLLQRRKLVSRLLLLDAVALAAAAAAPSLGVLAAALAVVGISSVAAQVLVPFASALAAEDERGRVVGRVMSGLLLGILLARTVAGFVTEIGGWRLMYGLAAGAMVVLAVVLRRALPDVDLPDGDLSYGRLLRSVGALVREEPRLRAPDGARLPLDGELQRVLDRARVPALRAAVRLQRGGHRPVLARRARGRGHRVGRRARRRTAATCSPAPASRRSRRSQAGACSHWARPRWRHCWPGSSLLDLGVQATQILNQSVVFRLRPEARSRLNTAYMTSYFAGAVSGSAGASFAWERGGWGGLSAAGGTVAALGVILSLRRS